MPIKGPLRPRDTPSPPIDEQMQSSSLDDDGSPVRGATGPIVYESHKKSTKLSVFKVTSRKTKKTKDDAAAAPQDASAAATTTTAASAFDDYPSISTTTPGGIFDRTVWSETAGTSFNVRGKKYLKDKKKFPSEESLFRLITAEVLEVTSSLPRGSVCLHADGRVQSALSAGGDHDDTFPPFLFCVNIRIPHSTKGREYHIVSYFAVDDLSTIDGTGPCPSSALARRFFFGDAEDDDEYRDATFKFIPRIVKGNPIVKNAVGAKPVIMGKKLKQTYVRGEKFLELIIDVGSDPVADKIVKMCIGFAKTIVVDMAFVLEGKDEAALPERIMGAFCLNNIDFKKQRRVVEV